MKTTKVRIRMYRHGLGDCFLLTFFSENKKIFNMLVDCGVLSNSADYAKKMADVASDISVETNNSVDVLIATHAHWDHISGFVQAEKEFSQIKVKEVWLPWTENPKDKFAKSIKDSNNLRLKAIQNAYKILADQHPLASLRADQVNGVKSYLNAFSSFFGFYGIQMDAEPGVFGVSRTDKAMDLVKKKTKKIIYQTPKSEYIVQDSNLSDLRFYILGPPKDLALLKKMDPSRKNSEVYELMYNMSAWDSFCTALENDPDPNIPFNNVRRYSMDEAQDIAESYFKKENEWRRIDNDWLLSASMLAFSLDDVVNNTSLAFAIEFIKSGKVLLFAADAQVGNWLSWKNYKWTISNNDKESEVTIDDLFSRTVFYKVGHHGSHNATLKAEGLEKMSDKRLVAMLPCDKKMARAQGWNKMPFDPLVKALNDKTGGRVIAMDEKYPAVLNKARKSTKEQTTLYYDYTVVN